MSANTLWCIGVAHAGGEGRINILPWYRLVGVPVPPVSRNGGRTRLPARVSGRHVYGDDSPHLFLPKPAVSGGSKECARITGKDGENGQNSGEMGGSSPWTRPSAPGCGDTLKALASDQRSILGGDRPRRRLGVAIDWVTYRSYSSARRRLNVQSSLRKEQVRCCGSQRERSRP